MTIFSFVLSQFLKVPGEEPYYAHRTSSRKIILFLFPVKYLFSFPPYSRLCLKLCFLFSSTISLVTCLITCSLFSSNPIQFSSVQSLSHVQLFATPWTAACQASLSITNCRSLLKLMSIESVMPSNHLILCHPLLLLPSIFPSIRVFSNESVLHIRWPKYWSFSFNISPPNEYSGLISFRMDWLDILAVQGTLKSFLQNHSSKASILQHSTFFANPIAISINKIVNFKSKNKQHKHYILFLFIILLFLIYFIFPKIKLVQNSMTMITQHYFLFFCMHPTPFLRAPIPEGDFSQVDHVLSSFFKCLLAIYCMLVTVLTTGTIRQTKTVYFLKEYSLIWETETCTTG